MQYQDIVHRCFRCGYCKSTADYGDWNCPPHRKYRFESYSPGGRMWLLKAWLDGEIPYSDRLAEIFYSCTSCGHCAEKCVMEFRNDLTNVFIAARGEMVDRGRVPPRVRDYFKSLQLYGNPYKEPETSRGDWAEGLEVPRYDGHEWLLYVGCVGSYDERGRAIARSLATLLLRWKVSFGILGPDEICDGNEARVMGESGLFLFLAERNAEIFRSRGIRRIITLSPHAYNAFRNDYRMLGNEIEVVHASQFLASEVRERARDFAGLPAKVTYHDPCYLGRHNRVYREPRTVLRAIPGVELIEMEKSRGEALCCGGAGGNFFTDILGGGQQAPARARIRQAAATGADILAVACPTCAKMLQDAQKAEDLDEKLQVRELSEIVLMQATA